MPSFFPSYWSWPTMIMYIVLGLLAVYSVYKEYVRSIKGDSLESTTFQSPYLWMTIVIWTFIATARLVAPGTGGADAISYRHFFEDCLNPVYSSWMNHVADDVIFKWINVGIRHLSSNYRVYFAIVYGFMAWVYISFMHKFLPREVCFGPLILAIFLYWRSFSSLRSNLAIAVILLACMLMADKRWFWAFVVAGSTALIHKSSLLFALVIPFCFIFSKRELKLWHIIILIVLSSLVGTFFQQWFIDYAAEEDLSGAYGSYASRSLETNFMDNYWKIAFGQLLLGVVLFLSNNHLQGIFNEEEDDANVYKMHILWLICVFDLIAVPVCYILGVWRGYEYMLIPRIVLWSWILGLWLERRTSRLRTTFSLLFFAAFLGWMIFRFSRMYESSCLMPYIFEPFGII